MPLPATRSVALRGPPWQDSSALRGPGAAATLAPGSPPPSLRGRSRSLCRGVLPPLPRTRPSSGAPLWAPPVGTAAPGHGPVTAGRSVGGAALGLSPRVALTPLCLRDSPAAWPGPASRPKPPARQPLPGVRDTWHGYGSGAAPGPRALPACPRPASPSGSSPLGTQAGNTWWFLGGRGTGRKETSIPRERPSPGVPAFPLPPGPPSLRGRSARLSSLGLGAPLPAPAWRVPGPRPPPPSRWRSCRAAPLFCFAFPVALSTAWSYGLCLCLSRTHEGRNLASALCPVPNRVAGV